LTKPKHYLIFTKTIGMKNLFLALILLATLPIAAQSPTAQSILDKSIQYHDPSGNWETFIGQLNLRQVSPKSEERKNVVHIDIANEYFSDEGTRGANKIMREVKGDTCFHEFNGQRDIPQDTLDKYRLTCERAKLFRNYYTYLYGLPMKLKDPGTTIDEKALDTTFQDKVCWGIRVTYDPSVGKDIWYFYFDKTTYAMIGYRFYHDESKNDGEYIICEGEATVSGIKMPKTRHWYMHQADKFLGTDIIEE